MPVSYPVTAREAKAQRDVSSQVLTSFGADLDQNQDGTGQGVLIPGSTEGTCGTEREIMLGSDDYLPGRAERFCGGAGAPEGSPPPQPLTAMGVWAHLAREARVSSDSSIPVGLAQPGVLLAQTGWWRPSVFLGASLPPHLHLCLHQPLGATLTGLLDPL